MYIIVLDTGDQEFYLIVEEPSMLNSQAAGLYVTLRNWKLWLIFQKWSEPKETNREKESLVMKVWWLIFCSSLPLP